MKIDIVVLDKRASVIGAPVIVCGNSDYSVEFAFDAEWAESTIKTARFMYVKSGALKYQDVVFSGNSVNVPILSDIREVLVGVYAGDLQTTTPAKISCQRSILCGTGVHDEPDPDVYNQLLGILSTGLPEPALIVCEATGDVVSVADASNSMLRGLTLYGKTTQNGTPTPENPVELVSAGESGAINTAVCGKNLADDSVLSAIGTWNEENKEWYLPKATTARAFLWENTGNHKGQFTLSYWAKYKSANSETSSTGLIIVDYTDETTKHVGSVNAQNDVYQKHTIITDANKTVKRLRYGYYREGETWLKEIQLEVGTSATEYEPYNAQTITASTPNGLPGIPVSSGGNYTDKNGQQWICDEIDFNRGFYAHRIGTKIFDGTENWKNNPTSVPNKFYVHIADMPHKNSVPFAYSSHFVYTKGSGSEHGQFTKSDVCYFTDATKNNDLDAWKAWLADRYAAGEPLTVVFALVEPFETHLSAEELAQYAALHTNKPNTTVYNDAGAGLKLAYNADTKAYIDNKFTELQNAILSAGANI